MKAKLHFVLSITILFSGFSAWSQQGYWLPKSNSARQTSGNPSDSSIYLELNEVLFAKALAQTKAGKEGTLQFPLAHGGFETFYVKERSVFHPRLAAKYPQITSFVGWNHNKTKTVRFSWSHKGLQAMLVDHLQAKRAFIDKEKGSAAIYSLHKGSERSTGKGFECHTEEGKTLAPPAAPGNLLVTDQNLRKFRIAISASGSYTAYHGGTVADALAAINASLTRINQVFETDVAVTLELVPNNDQIIFTDADTDPYTGNLNSQVQNTLSTIIGEENYDVGHLFNVDNDNGNAGFIGSVCIDNRKGSAFASALQPEGDRFDLDFVAHELGHQFGANHTWSFESEGTGVQVEPASGTTIMGYAGIVRDNNVAPVGDDYFHHVSIVQITDYLGTVSCGVSEPLTNNPPEITAALDYTIPVGTAFVLSGSATDSDPADVLTYAWEQIDDGVVVTNTFGPQNPAGANFRSLPPSTDSLRYFPSLSRVIAGELTQTNPPESSAWETVSNVRRDLNFALTVRDNAIGGGQVASDSLRVRVNNTAGPFVVLSQNSPMTLSGGSVEEILWDVANTDQPPINTATVSILLSVDGGQTFTTTLADNVPNTGMAKVQLPNIATAQARIMVKADNTIFYAVNSTNFTIGEQAFSLALEDVSLSVCQGDDAALLATYDTLASFSETVTFAADAPAGLGIAFDPSATNTSGTAINISFTNTSTLEVGEYPISLTASAAGQTVTLPITLHIFGTSFDPLMLRFPENGATGTAVNPSFQWVPDINASGYDIEIATDNTFTDIVTTASVSGNRFTSENLLPSTSYFWRVRPKNDCGAGVFTEAFAFSTADINCKLFDGSGSLSIGIPADVPSTISTSLFFVEDLRLSDVNVSLEIDHTFLEDLIIRLTSPSGTVVTLLSNNCGSANNLNAVFDADGDPFACSGNPAISGTVQPLGSLESFNGESIIGEWILSIEDTLASDGGELKSFSLEFCVEGVFRPDEDEDGVFDDGDDLCLGTPKGSLVDTSGCALNLFPTNNFNLEIQSESCRTSDDGQITISAMDTSIDYTAILTGPDTNVSMPFNEAASFNRLAAGAYSLCITGGNGTVLFRESCFEVNITEPESLSVLSTLLTETNELELELNGASFYTIEINGVITQTTKNNITLTLGQGSQLVRVTTPLECQGSYEEVFFVTETAVLYPNPVNDSFSIFTNTQKDKVQLAIFAMDGSLLFRKWLPVANREIRLDASFLTSGTYVVKLGTNAQGQTLKMLKQ
ncbi:Proprotein convertase P [Croceitalea dokdonensis DOKDO 023]|uniref:Proprotein convertase P n=1 Tax=Croceitalea dokdonensis DOKDO 023 TaxID=1300341 RepID=A0A0P7AUV2_9FLAO|nr:zinc-dependent metalloprotease family protein [Croceitalea dokdonensis]KPM32319.1 Proprotein convertase P [Croceitalea dokdonensis DOKDO 023]